MSVWAEQPRDGGSAVWGCSACEHGGWCSDHTTAVMEARIHASEHRERVTVLGRARGPKPDWARDQQIMALRGQQLTIRAIAATVGLSVGGVTKALHRKERA